ncbi:recombination-associated protein RdgC [Marinobacter halodurans]|nr:recombination-associated protein RdgC [Marinobacter halodurans]
MLFKKLTPFELPEGFKPTLEDLEMMASKEPARECQYQEKRHLGFEKPFKDYGSRIYALEADQVFYIRLRLHERILPDSVVNEKSNKRIEKFEKEQGEPLGRAEKRKIRADVRSELLSKALQKSKPIQVIIDLHQRELWIDQTTERKIEDTLSKMRSGLGSLPVTPFDTTNLPLKLKTWALESESRPEELDLGDAIKLIADDGETKSSVAIKHEVIEDDEWLRITAAREVEELELCTRDIIFKLHSSGAIKGIKTLTPGAGSGETLADEFYEDLWETLTYLRATRRAIEGTPLSDTQTTDQSGAV